MSISSEINRISGNVSDSLDAVAEKGVTVPAGSNSDDLPGLIRSIPTQDYDIIAPDYSDLTFPVSEGTYCIHNDKLYTANGNIPTSEAFDSTHWDEVSVGGELVTAKTFIVRFVDMIGSYQSTKTYSEIMTAISNGTTVIGINWDGSSNYEFYSLIHTDSYSVVFAQYGITTQSVGTNTFTIDSSNTVTQETVDFDISSTDFADAIASKYDDFSFPIPAGAYCFYDGSLFKSNQLIQTPEEFDSNHWDSAQIVYELYLQQTQIDGKADKANTVLDTTLSRGRKANTTVGTGSLAFGYDVESSAQYTVALGSGTVASRYSAMAAGRGTIAGGDSQFVFGRYNRADGGSSFSAWTANTSYAAGDRVSKRDSQDWAHFYVCIEANSDATFTESKWQELTIERSTGTQYIEIVGNGTADNARDNARALDLAGNEYLKGDLYVNCTGYGTGGKKVAPGNIIAYDYDDLTFPVAAFTYCIHNGTLYNNPNTISSSEAWNAAHWTELTVGGQLNDLFEHKLDAPLTYGTAGQVLTSDGNGGQSWQTPSSGGTSNVPTTDMEWEDVYSAWQAGYYYDPDNDYAYTQIPSTETTWEETETYINVSCTPYANMIPVKAGEQYRFDSMPVHFDSKNAEVPSIILFDSSKNEVTAYTRTYQDTYTNVTIPANAVWMAVVYLNSQDYELQKCVVKRHDKDAILEDVMADYRAYSLTTAPTKNTLTKGYICIGTDDLRPAETKNLHTMFTTAGIPYYMAAIPKQVKQCIKDDPYKTNKDYMDLCVAAGGEIVCHSDDWITASNKNDFDTMYQYFCKNKQELESYGYNVRGIFKAGGENAIYDAADPIIDAWATHYYEFGDYFTTAYPFYTGRTLLDDWETYSGLTTQIQNIVTNKSYGIFAFHYYNTNAQMAMNTIMSALSGYTEGVDYEFVTPSELYELLMPTTRPTSGGGSAITYSISMSGNVITLTGSNGSTSSVTLPVYNGGASS